MISNILFLIFSDINIWFAEKKLIKKIYKAVEVLSTTKRFELIDNKKFIIIAIDENFKTFIIFIALLWKSC